MASGEVYQRLWKCRTYFHACMAALIGIGSLSSQPFTASNVTFDSKSLSLIPYWLSQLLSLCLFTFDPLACKPPSINHSYSDQRSSHSVMEWIKKKAMVSTFSVRTNVRTLIINLIFVCTHVRTEERFFCFLFFSPLVITPMGPFGKGVALLNFSEEEN